VVCDEWLELLSGSNLSGKIQTRTLVVHEGAYIEVTGLKMTKPSPSWSMTQRCIATASRNIGRSSNVSARAASRRAKT
jgi:cytoskeletal protein CcmA (bactofilin family)